MTGVLGAAVIAQGGGGKGQQSPVGEETIRKAFLIIGKRTRCGGRSEIKVALAFLS